VDLTEVTSSGRSFHVRGLTTGKATVISLTGGTAKRLVPAEWRGRYVMPVNVVKRLQWLRMPERVQYKICCSKNSCSIDSIKLQQLSANLLKSRQLRVPNMKQIPVATKCCHGKQFVVDSMKLVGRTSCLGLCDLFCRFLVCIVSLIHHRPILLLSPSITLAIAMTGMVN